MYNFDTVDVSESDSKKLAGMFNTIKERVSIDETILDAKKNLTRFNEYIFNEQNGNHHVHLCTALDTLEDVR